MTFLVSPFAGLGLALLATADSTLKAPATHPLDPLTAEEVLTVRAVLNEAGRLTPDLRFAMLALREPGKEAVRQQLQSKQIRRSAEAVLYDWATSTPIRAEVDLARRRLIRWDTLPSREPPMRGLIRRRLEEIVRPDSRWTEALRRRGIGDPATVSIIPALGESQSLSWQSGDRVVSGVGYDQEALPGELFLRDLRLRVNLTRRTILELSDTGKRAAATALVPDPSPQTRSLRASPRHESSPFSVDGSQLRWRNWRLRFGVHPRRGLELWDVGWMQDGRERPILYRASVSEVVAAYGDPDFTIWYPRDAGNEGLGGYQANSAVESGDAAADAVFADAVMPDDFGRPVTVPRAAAIYERDGGLLWRHASRAQRARQLVLTSHATIDDYDFVFSWVFGEDGAIDVEVGLTGIMLLHRPGAETTAGILEHRSFGHLVAPERIAPNHQHFFSYRLDFDVDGATPNRVHELETGAQRKSRSNPLGMWFAMTERVLASEKQAIRRVNHATNRGWKIVNPKVTNSLGQAVGYALVPGETSPPFSTPSSPVRKRAGFIEAQFIATPYRQDEMYSAGEFQNFPARGAGLPSWTRANRSLLDTDVVVWYTLGVTHIPRPEEFPLMPVHRAGFRLIPSGFFSRNPALEPSDLTRGK